jgi:hypothetical protein
MFQVTFARTAAADAFISMAEGMWENQRDDTVMGDTAEEAKLALWEALLKALGDAEAEAVVILDDKFLPLVKDVIDNCADNAHDMGIDDENDLADSEDAELACAPFEVTIRQL